MGFNTKDSIAKRMQTEGKCCFLLRFSDSQLGSLTISRFDFNSARFDFEPTTEVFFQNSITSENIATQHFCFHQIKNLIS